MSTMLSDIQMRKAIMNVPNLADSKLIQAHKALAEILAFNENATELELRLFNALDEEIESRKLKWIDD